MLPVSVKIRAPAKINLGLRVVGKRADGYHLLDTIMVPVSLYDEIHLTKMGEGRGSSSTLTVTCDNPTLPTDEGNIVFRAAHLIIKEKLIREPVAIHIKKRIPIGAGLGGGSSDAAATLMAMNSLFRLNYSPRQLKKRAYRLGADVPFFIDRRPARARGIGERLTPIKSLAWKWAVIVYPGFPVATSWVYRNLEPKLTKAMANTSIISPLRKSFDQQRLLVNDLESVTVARYPRIRFLKEKLIAEGAAGALMSGSGSAVFGLFDSRGNAARALSRLQKEDGVETFLVRLLT
ncbi:MAG TPA: 4-(cytidine 5'-diphospho)-2-C-methyl-D-erythritol kinase [Candidatus Binatia bacterium]